MVQKIVKQTPPAQHTPSWKQLLAEAQVKQNAGLAQTLHEALGQVAQEQPLLYEQYREEHLAAKNAPVAKQSPPVTVLPPMPPGILTEADGQPVPFEKQVAYWQAHPEERRRYERHFGRRV
jgi:hypothetical protein